ncbi:solute carrier family 5 (choline transporter), member 7 [Nesidiocoris tenuis]|uniref:Solute carrier family 5 (Choline transporter), member 7 n=1 Tax=Nesidiocoris tenuis TaxID=355587 RepID=A0ABN7AK09_9HEMI|nr:solute carrier family 5 (choline transporter), member 7 [Nesidiocoris tenuis]
MALFLEGAITIFLFYFLIMGVGVWAARKKMVDNSEVETMNAGRRLGFFVGLMTLVGTWAGGGYFVGTAEKSYSHGVVNVQVPIGLSISLVVGACFYIKPMRTGNYITLIDIFQEKYGVWYGATLTIPAILGEFFWISSVLNSLGTTLQVVIDIPRTMCIIISAFFAGLYTILGGLTSVTYTDILQIFFIITGIGLATPYIYYHDHPKVEQPGGELDWVGSIEKAKIGYFVDHYMFLIFGGIPWQGYFQRVFSVKSTKVAQWMSIASFPCLILIAIPCLIIGASARATDWKSVPGWEKEIKPGEASLILALTLRFLTPMWVSLLGLGAVAAAVMSSADSSILASSSLFTRNVYKHLIRPMATFEELHNCLRLCICIVTILAGTLACFINSVYDLSLLCADIIFVVLFPQLTLIIYAPSVANIYGSSVSYFTALTLRILTGDDTIGVPASIRWPMFDSTRNEQYFPFRTTIMLIGTVIMIVVGYLAHVIFEKKKYVSLKYDFLKGFSGNGTQIELAAPSSPVEKSASIVNQLQ